MENLKSILGEDNMTLKICIQWLLDNNYGILVDGFFVTTKKLNDELVGPNNIPPGTIINRVDQVSEEIQRKEENLQYKKDVWTKFCDDAGIPYRVIAPGGSRYTVRQFSSGIASKLIRIIKDPNINYTRLVESTKNYYATVTYKALLSNYFDKELWRVEYDSFDKIKNNSTPNDSSSRWED